MKEPVYLAMRKLTTMPKLHYFSAIFKQTFARYQALLLINLVAMLPFIAIAFYIKVVALSGYSIETPFFEVKYYQTIEFLEELFSKPLDPIPYLGLFSKISQLLWCFPIAFCLFATSILPSEPQTLRQRQFLWISSALLTLLLLDDVFRISLNLYHSSFSIPKHLLYYFYMAVALFSLVRFRRQILSTPYGVLGISVFFFGLSLIAEFFPITGVGTPIMLEDGGQLLGILNVAAYYWISCRKFITLSYDKRHE
ncbi:MAG: hypothetical protein F6K42_04760 [Leptolyngbya sp. SIO1D8]|nr:hypothetical protein [Leptolyngbya sp. SIO1D8]